ncbi:hypothetical protein KP509_02G051000 [Ceratopteris richardii]|uniref:DUF4283 domain-containing protein n=1 Tax=Ceratopteris richardii TaxID=49495 RepID=A0A8T2V8T2_CERRI|nr:hypothetical protein KP509_02G051000 [Ceratopteris richardii]
MDSPLNTQGVAPTSSGFVHHVSQPTEEVPQTPLPNEVDFNKLKCMMEEALTHDEEVHADLKVDVYPSLIWDSALMFHERGLLLFFTTHIPLEVDVALAINESVDKNVVDKVFYSGHGLFEVVFMDSNMRAQFLELQTIFLCGLMAHVFPWKPVKAMKEELLYKCPVWVELIDLPSFLWASIGHIAKVLGKVLYTPIFALNKSGTCVLWNTSGSFPKTLGINVPNVGRIVIYLKWGYMAGACFHCGNLRHYSKNFPSLKIGANLIPTCPGSKILVPEEQVFGKQKTFPSTNMQAWNSIASFPRTNQGYSGKGKECISEKQLHPAAPTTPAKRNVYRRREGEGTSKDAPVEKGGEAGKRVMDNDGFTPVTYEKALLYGKRSKFQSCYSASPLDGANFAPHTSDFVTDCYEKYGYCATGFSPSVGPWGLPSCFSTDLMKLATSNIQGLGQYGKWTRLWRWIVRHQLDLPAIQEHKKHDHAGVLLHTKHFQLRYNAIKNNYSGCLFIVRKDIQCTIMFDDPHGRVIALHLVVWCLICLH